MTADLWNQFWSQSKQGRRGLGKYNEMEKQQFLHFFKFTKISQEVDED